MENIKKYFNCKAFERARLAKHRDAARYVEVDGVCCYCCPGCRKAVDMDKLYEKEYEDKFYRYYDCVCGADMRFRSTKKVYARTGQRLHPAQGRCQRCMAFICKCRGCGKAVQKIPKIVIKFDKLLPKI